MKNSDSNLAKIKVVDLTKKQLDVSVKISGSTIIVTPNSRYNVNTPYFLLIDAGLESVNGEVTKKGTQMRFTFTQ